MKLFYTVIFLLSLASAAFAREESVLARVTSYWANEGTSGEYASTGGRLRPGHCAVDPKRIPYGSKVVFPDGVCTAVDTGPAVVNRKAARLCGRTASQLKAIVVDRFFETKLEAMAWTNAHPEFMTLQIVPPGSDRELERAVADDAAEFPISSTLSACPSMKWGSRESCRSIASSNQLTPPFSRDSTRAEIES